MGIMAGLVFQIVDYGAYGIWKFFIGFMTPILIMYIFYLLKMFGAGDIKTFAVIGGLFGPKVVMSCMIYSIFAGGVCVILVMIKSKTLFFLFYRVRSFFQYVSNCIYTKKIVSYNMEGAKGQGAVVHFTISIFLGFLITMITYYR